MKIIAKLQKLFPDKAIDVDKSNNSITVKNIDNSLVYINPLDKEDLAQLRTAIQADQEELFDGIIKELIIALNQVNTPRIKHFFLYRTHFKRYRYNSSLKRKK